ncbi:MAG: ATP-dependent zinc metalloprotease FtsH [Desulfohalobiaceae bacterium]|nr:ATP-dependent zinc metalloprotease FtsH [Desulfohalobiaceae bacterium]
MNNFLRNLILWATISLVMVVLFNMFNNPQAVQNRLTYSEFLNRVEQGEVLGVQIQGQKITGRLANNQKFITQAPDDPNLVKTLLEKKVEVEAKPREDSPWYITVLVSWFPMLLLIGVWIFFMRQMQGGAGGGKAFSFGRSKAKMLSEESPKVSFEDVAGVEEAKEELTEVVDFLSNPQKFTRLGGRIPKGVLLVGPPGTGKTLLARAVAGEAGVPFFSISGSDFVEMFVGVGASRVRDLFVQGKKNAPCLIFIDEMDAVGRQRGAGMGGGHDEREQTLNQLLVEMDGFEANEGVILIAATNRPDVLDPALLRPGRFDRQVVVPNPDLTGRRAILYVYAQKVALSKDVDLDILARGTPGFSGADLENMVNEAALIAAKFDKEQVDMVDLEMAKDKVLMGKERRTMILTEEEKTTTAYHEGGHALVAKMLPKADPVHKVSIIPRGQALGITMQLPVDDRHTYSLEYLESTIAVMMGGRVAELLFLNQLTTGAGNDLDRATKMARKMVCEWGMSETFGSMSLSDNGNEVFLGRELVQHKHYSEDTARLIDQEVKGIIQKGFETAKKILEEHAEAMKKLAHYLLERETINAEDLNNIMSGQDLAGKEEAQGKNQAKAGSESKADTAEDPGPGQASGVGPEKGKKKGGQSKEKKTDGDEDFTLEEED